MTTIAYSRVQKVAVMVVFTAVVAISIALPHTTYAQTGAVTSAFKSIVNFFSDKEVIAQVESNVFPEVEDRKPTRTILAVMTAYSSDVAQTDATPCIPADWKYDLCENYEKYGEQNTIAANFLPMGTKVRFPDLYGDKVFVVRDRMNARYGAGRGDIWMPTRAEAVQFGVRKVTMEIYSR
jgi:3D (Asp-Asp-Asp) domain-containing protein